MGREASIPAEAYLPALTTTLTEFAENRREVMVQLWEEQGRKVATHTEMFNRVPIQRLPLVAFKVGDYFYHKQVPRRWYRDNKEEAFVKIGTKLQYRYTGPYRITALVPGNEVVYEALVHNVTKRVHVINMKKL